MVSVGWGGRKGGMCTRVRTHTTLPAWSGDGGATAAELRQLKRAQACGRKGNGLNSSV